MSKPSRGPWRRSDRSHCEDLVLDADGIVVCEVGMINADNNLPLIASAPTLAARLDEAVGLLRNIVAFAQRSNLLGEESMERAEAFLAAIDTESAGGR